MQFSAPAPGLLTPSGGGYVGTWQLSHVEGISVSQAAGWVNSALNDSRSWTRAGVSAQQVGSGGSISVWVVNTITGYGADVIGLCEHFSDGSCRIQLEAWQYPNPDLVNHEFIHGFFFADHSPEGSDS